MPESSWLSSRASWSIRRATAFSAWFDSPLAAVRAAIGLVDVADRLDIQIRAGVHTGEVEMADEALTGLSVHIGARVLAEAGPGEIVVTGTTHDLTSDAGLAYEPRGSVVLRGVTGARNLYAIRPE